VGLGHTFTRFRVGRKTVALNDGDLFIIIGQYASGQQTAHTATDNNGLTIRLAPIERQWLPGSDPARRPSGRGPEDGRG
jgi:hypothetical protein